MAFDAKVAGRYTYPSLPFLEGVWCGEIKMLFNIHVEELIEGDYRQLKLHEAD